MIEGMPQNNIEGDNMPESDYEALADEVIALRQQQKDIDPDKAIDMVCAKHFLANQKAQAKAKGKISDLLFDRWARKTSTKR